MCHQALIGKQSRLLKIREHLCLKPRDGLVVSEMLSLIERELRLPERMVECTALEMRLRASSSVLSFPNLC